MNTDVASLELAEAPAGRTGASAVAGDLSLVGHVPVQLEAVIGHCELPVSRLMALSAGDVLALLTGLDDPIELRLNERTVARGELVAVGDHFGVRIIEVL